MAAKKKITKKKIPTPVDESREERRLSVAWTGTILIVLTIAMIGLGMADLEAMTERSIHPGWNWVAVLILMFAFVVVLGVGLNGRLLGILINEQMLMSLSRFQMVIWTLLVLSAYFVIALVRIRHGDVANPLGGGYFLGGVVPHRYQHCLPGGHAFYLWLQETQEAR